MDRCSCVNTSHPSLPSPLLCSHAQLQLKCAVEHISFSAHADFDQTNGFLNDLAPPNVVLVHGEAVEMGRLKGALERSAATLNLPRTVHTPKNNQVVQVGQGCFFQAKELCVQCAGGSRLFFSG